MSDPTPIHETFREAREKAHLSQAEVSRRLNRIGMKVSPSTVTKWESGERGISMEAAMRLCDVLGVNWRDLYQPVGGSDSDQVDRLLDPLRDRLNHLNGQLVDINIFLEDWRETLDSLATTHALIDIPEKGTEALSRLPKAARELSGCIQSAGAANDTLRGILYSYSRAVNGSA